MWRRATVACLGLATVACLGGCGDDSEDGDAASDLPQGSEEVSIDPDRFSATVDNRFWPMKPGTRWTYRESEGGETLTVVVTATSETKRLANGVEARVVRDTVTTESGELIEDTLDWYAQDDEGNVWYMGEDTAEFEDGEISSREGAWEAGVDGALPGIAMPAKPEDGMQYRQEYYEGEAEDNGEILSTEEQAQVPAGHYTDVVLTKDTIALEPKVLEFKLYAPDVGPVLVFGVSGGAGREELIKVEQVGEAAAREAGTARLGEPYR